MVSYSRRLLVDTETVGCRQERLLARLGAASRSVVVARCCEDGDREPHNITHIKQNMTK